VIGCVILSRFFIYSLPGAGLAPHKVCGMFAAWWLVSSKPRLVFLSPLLAVGLAVSCDN